MPPALIAYGMIAVEPCVDVGLGEVVRGRAALPTSLAARLSEGPRRSASSAASCVGDWALAGMATAVAIATSQEIRRIVRIPS